ncbi:MAG: 2Fe-2S iron-sulfur cluster-binding protein [Synechococcaceae cyanobacterium]|nr:2Fe-2S iron-sulfur cluster-binding protein [Synechococcaceae cyanobacterium]
MPVIRFVREDRDVPCYPGENLREVALREGIELYGLKGKLGNCGGCGQCITCFVDVVDGTPVGALSPRTPVEDQKLRRRPQTWRLACQALVQQSLLVITRPQVGLSDRDALLDQARARALPTGPTSWPEAPAQEEAEQAAGSEASSGAARSAASATSDEATPGPAERE